MSSLSTIHKTLHLLALFSVILLISTPKTLAQSVTESIAPSASSTSTGDDDDDDNDDDMDDKNDVDCDYNGSVKDYLSCAKNKISTPMLIGAGVGITIGIILLAFLCIWLTRKKRRRAANLNENENSNSKENDLEEGEIEKNGDIDIKKINRDLENDPKSFYTKDIEDRDIKFNVNDTIDDGDRPKSQYIEKSKNKPSFELLNPPKPNKPNGNSQEFQIDSKTLKITPSINRKGSRDNLYSNSNTQPLKHAPSTRRPRPTTNHQAHQSIHGQFGTQPIRSSHVGDNQNGNGNLAVPVQGRIESRSGSPIQFKESNEKLEIKNPNPNPLSRENSLYAKNQSRSVLQLPIPNAIHSSEGKRAYSNLPKPTNRLSIPSPVNPPAYAMGPQPPPPTHARTQSQVKSKKQLPLRGASQSNQSNSTLKTKGDVDEKPRSESPPRPSIDGRSGTFGPNLAKQSDRDSLEMHDTKKLHNGSQVDSPSTTSLATAKTTKTTHEQSIKSTTPPSSPTKTTTPTEPLSRSSLGVLVEKTSLTAAEEHLEKELKKGRKKDLRQTNLIPSYYATATPLHIGDKSNDVDLPNPFDKAFEKNDDNSIKELEKSSGTKETKEKTEKKEKSKKSKKGDKDRKDASILEDK